MKYNPIGTIARMWANTVDTRFMDSLVELRDFSHRILCKNPGDFIAYRKPDVSWHESARNQLVRSFVGDWLLMLDTDHCFAPDLLVRLLRLAEKTKSPVLSGIYQYKFPPHAPVAGYFNEVRQLQPLLDWNRSLEILDVSVVGGGCLLVRREVYDRIRVELREEPFNIHSRLSEDYSFCVRCEKLGIPVRLAPLIECHHVIPTVLSVRDYQPGLWKPNEGTTTDDCKTPVHTGAGTAHVSEPAEGIRSGPDGRTEEAVERVCGDHERVGEADREWPVPGEPYDYLD